MSKDVRHLGPDSQVLRACKHLLRSIRQARLEVGDRLPTQAELRATTEFSNDTLSGAMRLLTANGVLRRKAGVGTVVARPVCTLEGLWTIGLLTQHGLAGKIPVYAQWYSLTQEWLATAGCRFQLHLEMIERHDSAHPWTDFHLLPHDLAEGRLDGILTFAPILPGDWAAQRARGVPICHLGTSEIMPCGAIIDQLPMTREAVGRLAGLGCRKLGLVSLAGPTPENCRFMTGFQQGLAAAGLPQSTGRSFSRGEAMPGGQAVGRDLLALPPGERPDGLVVTDDRIGMGLAAVLREDPGYRPRLAVQTNLQAPLAFALPAIRFEVDLAALAALACRRLLAMLHDSTLPEGVDLLAPRMLVDRPQAVASTTAAAAANELVLELV